MTIFKRYTLALFALLSVSSAQMSQAAVSLDRTRVIFVGSEKSVSLSISNQNTQLPYLAQGWIENEQAEKVTSPMVVLPPVQRLEPGASSQVKIQGLPELSKLPQDRESLFYFNLREIPPRSDKPNTLQIALQTRVKLFYRPLAIAPRVGVSEVPWQEKLTLTRRGDNYQVNNPTPFYITVIEAAPDIKTESPAQFKPFMIAPKSQQDLGLSTRTLGEKPVLTYVNDYGGRPQLQFNCVAGACTASPVVNKK
ncbi:MULTISPECIES: fimbria/pilus periplasmic chaperone [Pseudomonas]|uniref:Fimbria/pilus periplasmic chaperone n=2 Tax=Pseudomonas gessardii TaxID=78544 RepID=A0ABS9F9V8_9PSED|nr:MULTISPECIES: fimbria/pilus periplasmic chaperone [Pseudomonas]MBH3423983.1 fimbria/pilus periplasmic chaperone [Pseudomonas gessardii]MCF4982136.1 fimbria/pilus periplasmic chaperone [Pseudomonas gessardii]MCF4991467.1 fimbria/pilus periplasmic chaperone [Pseudomonas gessardii]MCF5098834.1 fimbria/pilus periplasmic chaperone [Pseudomonas gessardii]MCF5109126.1 fimbria/pilus periplasmic chaperone [Pseudomonas gessardii]